MERLENNLDWKKNERENFSIVHLLHDGCYKGADEYLLYSQVSFFPCSACLGSF